MLIHTYKNIKASLLLVICLLASCKVKVIEVLESKQPPKSTIPLTQNQSNETEELDPTISIHKIMSNQQELVIQNTALDNFSSLPKELWQMLLNDVGLNAIGNLRILDRGFYQLITGNARPCMLADVDFTLKEGIYTYLWRASQQPKLMRFIGQARNLIPEHMPAFPFCQLVGSVADLPPSFWPYLKYTNVRVVDLSGNKLGNSLVIKFLESLRSTLVNVANLGDNQINWEGAGQVSRKLKNTKVHTVGLADNFISAKGAKIFAENLPGTNIQRINLSGAHIGPSGAIDFINNLKNTEVHTLNLSDNALYAGGVEGIKKLAKSFKNTKVHTLSLGGNNLGLGKVQEGGMGALIEAFFEHLEESEINKIDLFSNQINNLGIKKITKWLPKTQVQVLSLSWNAVDNLGINWLADGLQNTTVHTVNLNENRQIDDAGILSFANKLSSTKVHTVYLCGNYKINEITQSSLQVQYPAIKCVFDHKKGYAEYINIFDDIRFTTCNLKFPSMAF